MHGYLGRSRTGLPRDADKQVDGLPVSVGLGILCAGPLVQRLIRSCTTVGARAIATLVFAGDEPTRQCRPWKQAKAIVQPSVSPPTRSPVKAGCLVADRKNAKRTEPLGCWPLAHRLTIECNIASKIYAFNS